MNSILPIIIAPAILLSLAVIFFLGYALGKWGLNPGENEGEARVRKVLLSAFRSPEYHLLSNITLPFEDGTTQIDHILVSTKGVFVLEAKHFSGWIFPNEKGQHWTQVIYKVKNRFSNPLRQNYRHVKVVRELLDFLPKEQIHSLIVFTGDAVFKSKMPDDVVYLRNLVARIDSFQEDVISLNRLHFVVGRIECTRFAITRKTDVAHRAYLNRKYGEN